MIIVTSIVPRTMPGFDFPILFPDGFCLNSNKWLPDGFSNQSCHKLIRCDLKSWDQSVSRPDAARGVESLHWRVYTTTSQAGFFWHRSLTLISKAQQEKAFLGPSKPLCQCFTLPNPKQTIQDRFPDHWIENICHHTTQTSLAALWRSRFTKWNFKCYFTTYQIYLN